MAMEPLFEVGQRVRVTQIMDNFTSKNLIGLEGEVEEVDELINFRYNYIVGGRLFHEEELEAV